MSKTVHVLQYIGSNVIVFLIEVTGFLGDVRRISREGGELGDRWRLEN